MGKTLFDEIKGMSATELAEFLAKNDGSFIRKADDLICSRCENKVCRDKDGDCAYLHWSNADTVREWLLQEVNESEAYR
mgnify:CR=1 FL=1